MGNNKQNLEARLAKLKAILDAFKTAERLIEHDDSPMAFSPSHGREKPVLTDAKKAILDTEEEIIYVERDLLKYS